MLVLRDGGDVPGESERNQLLPSGLPSLLPSPVVTREQVKPGPEPAQLARLPPLARLWDGVQQRAWSISLFNNSLLTTLTTLRLHQIIAFKFFPHFL